jgi:hypothetical protein
MYDEYEEDEDSAMLQHYIEIGAVEIEGVDENGEIIFAISEKAKEVAPELWESHMRYVDESLVLLYEMDLIDVEYDENLNAIIKIKEEGKKAAKDLGLIPMDLNTDNIPND